MSIRAWLVCLTVAALGAAACGGDSPTSSSPQPFSQTINGTVSSLGTTSHTVTIPRSGNARWSVSWTGGDLDLYLTATSCNAYPPGNCTILQQANGFANPEVLTRAVTSGETFKLWVDSFVADVRSYTIVFTVD